MGSIIETLKSKLTILIPTHLIKNESIDLISKTIICLENNITDCSELIISVDVNKQNHPKFNDYITNLNNIKTRFDKKVIISKNPNIIGNFLSLIDECKTDYFLLFEHDWEFLETPNIIKCLECMEKYEFINDIRFNKRHNIIAGGDTILELDESISEIKLCKTSAWSNNPKISRLSKWDDYKQILNGIPKSSPYYYTLETPLDKKYKSEISSNQFKNVHKKWGQYIYGELDKSPMVKHLDGKYYF